MMMLNRNRFIMKSMWNRVIVQCGKATSSHAQPTAASSKITTPSGKVQVGEKKQSLPQDDYINLDNTNIVTRAHSKMPARLPLVKNFFIAKVDKELLAYPEVLDKEDLDKMVSDLRPVAKFFTKKAESGKSVDLFKGLKELKALTGSVPEEFGGKSFFATETYFSTEAESNNAGDALAINSHRLVIEAVKEFGSSSQCQTFLPKLARGDAIATTALFEEGNDALTSKTKALLDDDETHYTLNGQKNFVLNAVKSNLALVSAQTNIKNFLGDSTDTLSVFLVDLKSPGVTIHPAADCLGCDDVQQTTISFKDVRVNTSSLIGECGKGTPIVQKMLLLSRMQAGAVNITQMKKILNYLIEQTIHNEIADEKIHNLNIIRNALGRAATSIYAAESMLYFTASIPDLYEKPDIEVESAIVKVYSQKKLLEISTMALDYFGAGILNKGSFIEQTIRDSIQLHVLGEPIEFLRLFIGSKGLQHAGNFHQTDVKRTRNPLYNPNYAMMTFFKRETVGEPNVKLDLLEHVHPSFDVAAQHLELSIGRLRIGANKLLATEGSAALDNHMGVLRMSESAIEVYALFCGLARASRAYCIGLRYSDYDRLLATTLAHVASEKVLYMMLEVENGAIYAYDVHFDKVTEQLIHCGEYFVQHPLTRNF